jgi:hypothetical protein
LCHTEKKKVTYKNMVDRLLNGYLERENVIQEKGSWFLVHKNIPAHSARIVKHFLANPVLLASTTHLIHLTFTSGFFLFPPKEN